ncbi:MAG: hypothetical protein V3S12_05315, partial [Acidiferrobacterales bacterium]
YIDYYYTQRGKAAPIEAVTSGIKHGHLVEFGTVHTAARPFLWPAAMAKRTDFTLKFARVLKKKTEAAVRKAAKRRSKK